MRRFVMGRLLLCLLSAVLPLSALAAPAEVTQSAADGLTIEYTTPPYTTRGVVIDGASYTAIDCSGLSRLPKPGYPDLPYASVPFAIPPGASVTVTVLTNDETRVPLSAPPEPAPTPAIEGQGEAATPVARIVPDRAFYSSGETYPPEVALVGVHGRLRFQDVAAVSLHPFHYDAGTRSLVVSTRLVVRVEWGAPGAMPKNLEPVAGPDKYWEPVYRSLLPNYETAVSWRAKPAAPAAAKSAPARAPALDGPQWKIPVKKSGLYRVDASALTGLPSGISIESLRLCERIDVNSGPKPYVEGEVPIHVVDADGDGQFGAGDSFVFYGQSYSERFADVDIDTLRMTDTHVYWLSTAGGGARMEEESGQRGYTGLTAPATFENWSHFEENHIYDFAATQVEQSDSWDKRRVRSAHFFWTGESLTRQYMAFEVHGLDAGSNCGLRVNAQNMSNGGLSQVRIALAPNAEVSGQDIPGSPFTVPTQRVAFTIGTEGLTIPPGSMADGSRVVIADPTAQLLFFDSIDVGYMRRYEAYQDRLDMTSGTSSGPSQFSVAKFTVRDLLLFDVTDPRAPKYVTLDPSQIVRQGPGNVVMTFQDDVSSPRKYAASSVAAVTAPEGIVAMPGGGPDLPLWEPSRDADYIMICADEFLPAVVPLKQYREGQGYRVELVSASEVYDEFSGGSPSAAGIMRYLKWAMQRRDPGVGGSPPAYLLLVGDASVDENGYMDTSSPNFLPTPVYFGNVPGNRGRELVSMDPRYVLDLTSPPGQMDWFEDLFMGRLPTGSLEETQAAVQKIIAYENFQPNDAWRGRVLVAADDQYSSTTLFEATYCYRPEEAVFETSSNEVVSDIHEDARLAGITTNKFFMASYLDTVAVLGRCGPGCCFSNEEKVFTYAYSHANVTPLFKRKLSQGALLVLFQGHGNSTQLAHEYLLAHYPTGGYTDVDDVQNLGMPFAFYAFACHVNQFARETERASGDCLGEQLLLPANRGAIASFASSAYEWLPSNAPIERAVSKAYFLQPPKTDLPSGGATRWILGPTMAAAKAFVVLDNMPYGRPDTDMEGMVESYCLLGEPALRMDALPPEYQVTVDGESFQPGTRLRAPADRDTVAIRAEIRDELDVRHGSVAIQVAGVPVADSLFAVLAPPDSPLVANRPFVLTYTHHLWPDTYDIVISAVDLSGRTGTFRIPVVLDAQFTAAGVTLAPQGTNVLPPSFTVKVVVASPVSIPSTDLGLFLDDHQLTASASEDPSDPGGRTWVLEASLTEVPDGPHTFSLRVDDGVHAAAVRSVSFQVNTGLSVTDVFNFPNPFSRETRFYYTLSRDAKDVQIRIYTVAGRLIQTLEGTTAPGQNMVPAKSSPRGWEGLDAEGDAVANGLYFYRLIVTNLEGKKVEILGRMARTR